MRNILAREKLKRKDVLSIFIIKLVFFFIESAEKICISNVFVRIFIQYHFNVLLVKMVFFLMFYLILS